MFVEINLRTYGLLSFSYSPRASFIENHLNRVSRCVDNYSSKYDKFIVMRDFNVETSQIHIKQLCETCNLKNLIKKPTCFKNIDNPSCIGLILPNDYKFFQNLGAFVTGLPDFHKLTYAVIKSLSSNSEIMSNSTMTLRIQLSLLDINY